MTAQLSPDPVFQWITTAGQPAVGYQLFSYIAGSTTPQATYVDSTQTTQNTNPVVLNAAGYAIVWLNPLLAYKLVLQDAAGNTIWTVDNINGTLTLNQSLVPTLNNTYNIGSPLFTWANGYFGSALFVAGVPVATFPISSAEIAAGFTNTTLALNYPYGNILRYGIVANSSSAAAANTVLLQQLFALGVGGLNAPVGPTGKFVFPNSSGFDAYYFAGVAPIRPGVAIDLQGCTLYNTYTAAATDFNTGLFYVFRDFSIENGTIVSIVNTSTVANSGMAIQVGGRGVGGYITIFDSLLTVPMGNIRITNMHFNMQNTGANIQAAIQLLGGIVNLETDNIVITGGGTLLFGIYGEYGWATSPGSTPGSQSSHPHNLVFKNTKITGLTTSGGAGGGIVINGGYNYKIERLYVNGGLAGLACGTGSALFYNPWTGVDDCPGKRTVTVEGVIAESITGTGISLVGAQAASGYLSGAGLTPAQQSDLLQFSISDCQVQATGYGIFVSGACSMKNTSITGTCASGVLSITDDCMFFDGENLKILNGSSMGVRADVATVAGWSSPRLKGGEIRDSLIAGNATQGLQFLNVAQFKISRCQIGYSTTNNGTSEATQNPGVLVESGCSGVICDSNNITVAGGGNYAYQITGSTSAACNIINPLSNKTYTGNWDFNNVSTATDANLAVATNIVNTINKYYGKQCIGSTSHKLFIAQGSAATGAGGGTWISVDNVTTITPV